MSVPPSSTSSPELRRLLDACHARDATAQRRLYENWYAFAFARARPYGRDADEAREIVQDAFLKLFLALARHRFDGSFAAYFHRIIVNAGIDHYRRYHRQPCDELIDLDCGSVDNTAPRALEHADCIRLLQQLPPTYRMVFNLYVFEGLRHPEIAIRLGINEGTSRSHLYKARRALRPLVGPYLQIDSYRGNE